MHKKLAAFAAVASLAVAIPAMSFAAGASYSTFRAVLSAGGPKRVVKDSSAHGLFTATLRGKTVTLSSSSRS